jgi:Fe-S-cluster containining protein
MNLDPSTDPLPEASPDPLPSEAMLDALERQMVRGAMHLHTVESQLAARVHALEATLYGLVDLMTSRRMLGESELAAAAHRVAEAIEARGEQAGPGVALRVDPSGEGEFIHVDCDARMHVCKGICCHLSFPLTAEEVEGGELKWDLGRPYFIRHDAHGACVHQEVTGACGVYDRRPGLCRRYSCAADNRIWKDFAGMVLNDEWIAAHLGPERPQLVQIRMDRM